MRHGVGHVLLGWKEEVPSMFLNGNRTLLGAYMNSVEVWVDEMEEDDSEYQPSLWPRVGIKTWLREKPKCVLHQRSHNVEGRMGGDLATGLE